MLSEIIPVRQLWNCLGKFIFTPLKNFQNIFPPHLDPCPQPFFPPPISIFGHIFPPLKNFLPENLVENKISLMENAIYPP